MKAFLVILGIVILILYTMMLGAQELTESEQKAVDRVGTTYGADGRPINQSEYAKSWHRVFGDVKLGGSGKDTITVNTSVTDGRQDVSFKDEASYTGRAWSLNDSNGNTYRIRPIGGDKFEIISSDSTDTSTIHYLVEGQ